MPGFFPHTGVPAQGYTSLPTTTFDTFLADVIADVGTGVNGWTLHDDLRGVGGTMLWPWCGGFNYKRSATYQKRWTLTQNSPTVTWGYVTGPWYYGARANWDFTPNVSQVSWDNVNWYTVTAVADYKSFTVSPNYAPATASNVDQNLYFKYTDAVVLKCTHAQKNFFVKLTRPLSYNCTCLVQVFEDWNASTHVGTNGGPIERVRGYSIPKTGATTLQYILFLLPGTFALWAGGDPQVPGGGQYWDLFYAGNLNAVRANDGNSLIQACSNQDFSGIGICNNGIGFSTAQDGSWGSAPMFRNISGNTWAHPQDENAFPQNNLYALAPRGLDYLWAVDRTNLDESARMQFVEYDAYFAGATNFGNSASEGKRGELRYLKSPLMNPSGMHLASLGVADDGNTYMMLRASLPWNANQQDGQGSGDWGTYASYPAVMSGFAHTNRTGSTGELTPSTGANIPCRRFFMLPINV